MNTHSRTLLASALSVALGIHFTTLAHAAQNPSLEILPANQAFSGLLLTPNAQTLSSGDFSFTFAQGVPYANQIAELDTLKFSLGLFPGMEANGRIVTKTYNANNFDDKSSGIRDLSASFKLQIPNFYNHQQLKFAAGAHDIGGATNLFDVKYLVSDYTFEAVPLRLSAGYGRSSQTPTVMNGVFGGFEYQPFDFVQLVGEYDSVAYNGMVKLFTPDDLLPYGIQASLGVQLYSSHENVEQTLWQTQISVPMASDYITQPTKLSEKLTLEDKLAVAQSQAGNASLITLQQALVEEGFLNVRLGHQEGQLIVVLENRRYNFNQIDGLGVALGIVSSHYSEAMAQELELDNDRFTLVSLANGTPMVSVSSSAQCYREFIANHHACSDLHFTTANQFTALKNVTWHSEQSASGFGRSQVILSPALRYGVATEYGVWDYSLALASNLYTPLWKGAAFDVRHMTPLKESDDYSEGGLWENAAFVNEIDRVVFHQALQLPYNLHYQFSVGKIRSHYEGFTHDAIWHSPQGNHAVSLEYSYYEHEDEFDRHGRPYGTIDSQLVGYTYSKPEWQWQFNALAGTFNNGDEGYKLTTNHWFGDVNVSATYLNSKFTDNVKEDQFLTLGISFPLGLWRDMSPGYVQVRGVDQFLFDVQTRIGETRNSLNSGNGGMVRFQHSLNRQYHNRGRYGAGYFESQTVRLRNAYLRYLDR